MILVSSGLVISKIPLLPGNCIFCCRQVGFKTWTTLDQTKVKHFKLMNLSEVFANSWICFIKRSTYLYDILLTFGDK